MRLLEKSNKLGWRREEDRSYLKNYPLTVESIPSSATPVILGIGWYNTFDTPVRDSHGRFWIGKNNLGYIRGGHAICALPGDAKDWFKWYYWYNQGLEGACVGYALSRAVSLMNKKTYDAEWLYKESQLVDEFDDTPPAEGTSIRAGCEILVNKGHKGVFGGITQPIDIGQGISKYRWATSVSDIHSALKNELAQELKAIPLLNSWGSNYPRKVWMPNSVLEFVVFEKGGEAAVLTDK